MARDHSGNKTQHTTREVRVMFEPTRLAQSWLQRTYERVVPMSLYALPHTPDFILSSPSQAEGKKRSRGGNKR